MCGIGGIVGGALDEEVLDRMAAAMAHRGPDGQRVWTDGRCGLAFRRLAIIDLDARAMQPMHLGPLHLVFNGEVYDYRERRAELESLGHRFVTESDTEVLLHAWDEWGEGALDRINAMFALAVWDDRDRSLTLAVDPFGEKPLLYARDGERFAFASDARALRLAVPGAMAPDEPACRAFVAHGTMPPVARSFFAGAEKLPAAHVAKLDATGRLAVRRYWAPSRIETPADPGEAAGRLRELLADSVRLRLRSDVPVGTSLSGGIDSSAIVALCGELGEGTRHAFTATFPGFERDEWHWADEVARAAQVDHHHAVTPTLTSLRDDLSAFVAAQEEPVLKLNQYAQYAVFEDARREGVTVLLDGQGADELLAGYWLTRGFLLRALGPAAAARAYLTDGSVRLPIRLSLARDHLPSSVIGRIRRGDASVYASAAAVGHSAEWDPEEPVWDPGAGPLRRELLREAFFTSLPQLLRYGDRNSMAHSREVRLPFLDRRVADFCLSLPARHLIDGPFTKNVLREAVRDVVPARVLARTDKVGYEPPQAQWLGSPEGMAWAAEVLLDRDARATDLYDTAALEADLARGAWRDADALWRALNVELWRAAFSAGSS